MNITYEDKVALIENEDIPDINKCNASDMNQIKEVVNSKANVIKLLTVSDEAPASCETGDKYYNTADEVIYTAIGTDEWGTDGEEPVQGYVYLDVENSKLYCYDGTTFSSYGGGTPSEVVISEEEPEATEEHKIWIPTGETGNIISEVVDSLAGNENNLAPSVRAVNEALAKTDWINISTNANYEVFYRTYGELVEISYRNIGSSTLAGYAQTTIATLPSEIKPIKTICDIPFQRRMNSVRTEILYSNGNINLFNWDSQVSLTESGLIWGHITYIKG